MSGNTGAVDVNLNMDEDDDAFDSDQDRPLARVHGQMDGSGGGGSGSQSNMSSSTLDESIVDTIVRDARRVGSKFLAALYPRRDKMLLREWDLWGPLFLYVSLALLLPSPRGDSDSDSKSSGDGDGEGPAFATVFVLASFGSLIVTLNTQLLGGSISFFQSLCVLGYCVLPLFVSLCGCRFTMLLLSSHASIASFIVRFILVAAALSWSIFASTVFMADCRPPNKKALITYPICLYYFMLSWMVLSSTQN